MTEFALFNDKVRVSWKRDLPITFEEIETLTSKGAFDFHVNVCKSGFTLVGMSVPYSYAYLTEHVQEPITLYLSSRPKLRRIHDRSLVAWFDDINRIVDLRNMIDLAPFQLHLLVCDCGDVDLDGLTIVHIEILSDRDNRLRKMLVNPDIKSLKVDKLDLVKPYPDFCSRVEKLSVPMRFMRTTNVNILYAFASLKSLTCDTMDMHIFPSESSIVEISVNRIDSKTIIHLYKKGVRKITTQIKSNNYEEIEKTCPDLCLVVKDVLMIGKDQTSLTDLLIL
jgi:hypothetical protein